MPLVEKSTVEEFGQRPPDAFHVALVVGDVGVGEIDPEADPLGERLPLFHVPPDRFLAAMDEGFDTEGLDLRLRVDAQLLADLHFDRQTVGVPARLPLAVFAPHRAVAWVEILDRPRQAVAGMGHAIGGWRALEEDEPLRVTPLLERLLVDATLTPELRDHGLDGGEVGLAADGVKHG